MASIRTEKKAILLGQAQKDEFGLNVGVDVVFVSVDHDGVRQDVALTPDEATRVGVTLIQLAHQAKGMAMAQQAQGQGVLGPPGLVKLQ